MEKIKNFSSAIFFVALMICQIPMVPLIKVIYLNKGKNTTETHLWLAAYGLVGWCAFVFCTYCVCDFLYEFMG